MALRFCKKCNKEQQGILITTNGEQVFKCSECKKETKQNKKENNKSAAFILKGGGWGAGGISRV